VDTITSDIAIIGAGGAGLRAASALAESAPALRIALISKVYPMRSHTSGRHEQARARQIHPVLRHRLSVLAKQRQGTGGQDQEKEPNHPE
jgi:succinate dehydrogenase/fumarate reductase flavoprotein subunit